MKRGEIYIASLEPTVGAEIQKTRPVLIVSNDINNELARTVTVVPLSSQNVEKIKFFEVLIPKDVGLVKKSKARIDQIRTLDKSRLTKKLGRIDSQTILKLNQAIAVHLDL